MVARHGRLVLVCTGAEVNKGAVECAAWFSTGWVCDGVRFALVHLLAFCPGMMDSRLCKALCLGISEVQEARQ